MQRVKNLDYDEDDLYSDDEDYNEEGGDEQEQTAEDRENFAALTPVVRAELEESGVQVDDGEIEKALYYYYWDVGKSVAYLKNSKSPQTATPEQQPKKEKPKSKFDEAAEKSAEKAKLAKSDPSTNGMAAKTEALKLDAAAAGPPQSKVRSKGLNVPKLWSEGRATRKSTGGFVVVGHVDHGKSTLMGRLLLDTGAVSQREVDKFKKQATDIGKPSFALAWVMDTGSEERERGVTVDIAQHHFSTDSVEFTILDAPGHRDFVPNMIGGASMANLAVLVVDANQLESGMKGQTREHIVLAHAVGLRRIVVAVNKLDSTKPAWSEDRFEAVRAPVLKLLTETGFLAENIAFVPCSGLGGENVVTSPSNVAAASWVQASHQTLLKQLESSIPPLVGLEVVEKPLRMQISDVFRGGISNPLSISGLMRQGSLQVGDLIVAQPSGETATIKGIEVNGEARPWTVAGEIPTLHLLDIEPQHLRSGDIVCTSLKPVSVVKKATVKVQAMDSLLPQSADVHLGRMHVSGAISQLVATVDSKGALLKKKPRMVKPGQTALLKLTLEDAVPMESGDRVVLRAAGDTIAAGIVQSVES
ncbi:related to translation elongation factor HBS1 protein [Ramularia collo-cygni]|uniref:Related to translation elongation factor HBS1 protein n=1 Tax=Ramularia collo-cygni TaxID=112498 RepID=A0A2D3VQ78_9PEZI|nr:related to translation elongation factor HBS1 protein [Ramularia collo-cygni]CZT25394.1 related to translation elongation factor HBS1 protein [Ramularia collo-cygni]